MDNYCNYRFTEGGMYAGELCEQACGEHEKCERHREVTPRCECKEPKGPYRCRECGKLLPDSVPEKSGEDKLWERIWK